MKSLSVSIAALNAEDTIEECLKSASFADEIILVLDSRTQDKTEELARKYTQNIFRKEWQGYAKTKNYAISKAKSDIILLLDSDELISHKLKEEIMSLLKSDAIADGYLIPEITYFLGKPIKHCNWHPAYHLRMFKNGKGKHSDKAVHEKIVVNGRVDKLKNSIIHYSHPDYKTAVWKLNEYSSLEVLSKIKSGEIKKVRIYQFITKPLLNFGKNYIWHKGFLDGVAGLILCIHLAIYEFFILVKSYEYLKSKESK